MPSVPALRAPGAPALRRAGGLGLVAVLATVLASFVLVPAASAAPKAGVGVSWVRAAHLVPGIGTTRIDLVPVDGSASAAIQMSPGASYGDVTGYQKVAPGTYTATVRPTSGTSTEPMLSRRFTITKSQAMTLAVVGTRDAPRLATLQDDLTPPAAGQVTVRVLPAASAAEQLTVAAVDGPVIVEDAVLGQATKYKAVPAGRWTLNVTSDKLTPTTQDVTLQAGGVYTVVVLDGDAGGITAKVVTDAQGMTAAAAADGSPMAGAAPRGGAQTGGGGTAPASSAPSTLLPLAGGALLLGAVLVGVRRRRTPVRVGR